MKNLTFYALAILCIALFLSIEKCRNKDAKLQQAIQNNVAMHDSIHYITLKNGQIEASRASYVMKADELKKANEKLYNELKIEKGNVKVITQLQLIAKDTNYYIPTKLQWNNGRQTVGFDFSTETRKLSGFLPYTIDTTNNLIRLKPEALFIEKDIRIIDLVLGVKKEDGVYKFFARSPDASVQIAKLDGNIDPSLIPSITKPKRFSIGPVVGYGYGANLQPSIFIGIGAQLSLIRF